MSVPAPQIDDRDVDAILEEVRALVPFYTPEWLVAEDAGAGGALLKIFARMLEGLIVRLNEVPRNNFIAFLDMLGVKLLPAQPARAPLTFALSTGAQEATEIPRRSQAAATPPEGGEPILFETEKAILATPAQLQAVFSVMPDKDQIFDHSSDLLGSATAELFADARENLQEHILYIGDPDLFNVQAKGTINLTVDANRTDLLQPDSVTWEWANDVDHWNVFSVGVSGDTIGLTKEPGEIQKIEINGTESRWIRCRVNAELLKQDALANLEISEIKVAFDKSERTPDAAFANDIPLPLPPPAAEPLAPFGTRPRQGDTFYLASQEVFSKPEADVVITIKVGDKPVTPKNLILSWEYWNGRGWRVLNVTDNTTQFSESKSIDFTVPADLEPTVVGGQENYWIRVKIASGDYGQEIFRPRKEPDTTNIEPPFLSSLTLSYTIVQAQHPASIVTLNNLQYVAETTPFSPFVPLDDDYQAMYLGFDQAPLKGPISIFFSLREQVYTEKNRPRLEWEYFRRRAGQDRGEWARLEMQEDGTRSLTRSGMVQFIGPPDFTQRSCFGKELFCIRALDVESKFEPTGPGPASELKAVTHEVFCPPFSGTRPDGDRAPAPKVKAIHLNTAWAIQAETITDEILGSGTGEADQAFMLAKLPVIEEEIWVDELGALSEAERKALMEGSDVDVDLRQDEDGNTLAFWVRWYPIEDLTEAQGTDRVYAIDHTFGQILFGDGLHGMALPIGRNNVRATYQAGGGASGNLEAGQITALRTTIPRVDGVTNPEPAGGGSDTESVKRALERGPQKIRNRGRAVTLEDFEWIAREASRSIARVKVLPNFNDAGELETNWVTVIIVPSSAEPRPMPSPQLRQQVQNYLQERAANVIVAPGHIQVAGPTYVEVKVVAEIFPISIDRAPQVEAEAFRQLGQLLHPLRGGSDGRGWEFGRLPCFSDFYALLEAIEGVDHVGKLTITLQVVDPLGVPMGAPHEFTGERPLPASMPEYALIFSGDHKITVK
jgi:predicted phage baseplate assembly protein